ncbi:hypothetical protein F5879DRAFT_920364 [Lentinula edodes]|nr:hypothetical protein F5879DRAFT_920364 [Lentinula edodes]KAJ3923892.1 hypothetical protein F5877DRAFT_62829 [Lentinula edodes]
MATAISSTLSAVPSMVSSSASSSDCSRVVRFDDECVLIPELQPIKRPIIITKSYTLPLWRRKTSDDELSEEPSSPVLRVPFPKSFQGENLEVLKSWSRSNNSAKSPSSSCAEGVPHRKLERRPSLPSSPLLDNAGKPLPTIPLRSCCPDCVSITEECLKEGEAWIEKFTRGARRRRSSSGESDCGFTPVASMHQGHKDIAVVRLGSSASINVDEVDKRRRSREIDAVPDFLATSPSSPPITPHVPSAIIEEDEDQLFPLPSPRRSPNSSPANSTSASPMPSPNASSSHLSPAASSNSPTIPEEGILAKSLMRKGSTKYVPKPSSNPNLVSSQISFTIP